MEYAGTQLEEYEEYAYNQYFNDRYLSGYDSPPSPGEFAESEPWEVEEDVLRQIELEELEREEGLLAFRAMHEEGCSCGWCSD